MRILSILVLCFSTQGEDILSVLKASVMCSQFSMQEEDILEQTNVKCHMWTIRSTCRPFNQLVDHCVT